MSLYDRKKGPRGHKKYVCTFWDVRHTGIVCYSICLSTITSELGSNSDVVQTVPCCILNSSTRTIQRVFTAHLNIMSRATRSGEVVGGANMKRKTHKWYLVGEGGEKWSVTQPKP